MVRLKLVDSKSGLPITPVMYGDNYVSLVPGESRDIAIEFDAGSVPGGGAALRVEGWNVVPGRLATLALGRERN